MFDRLEVTNVACASGVTAATPTEVPLNFPTGILRQITIVIPDGHTGLTGIALGYGHNPVFPSQQPSFMSGNDEVINFPYKDDQPGVPWSAFVCNLDGRVHTWQVRFYYDELQVTPTVPSVAIPTVADIQSAGEALLTGP